MLLTGETSKMTLVESLRDAMDITLNKDSTSSKMYILVLYMIITSTLTIHSYELGVQDYF